ncbi:MAG: molecular chaperone HtpG [Alphaproteobacteria bacterium]
MSTDPGSDTPDTASRPFEAEVSRLLHMMVHSVYANTDVFLRELISNSADACEKLRTMALHDASLELGEAPFQIRLAVDKAAGTLVVEDNGVGMDRAELIDNLGTIARSGTRAFLEGVSDDKAGAQLIGQFGVGFYAVFMVAREVEVVSRRAGADDAWRWSSDGSGHYDIGPVEVADAPARGTRVTLHLKDDASDYGDAATVERVVAAHSAHVPVPIVLAVGDGLAEKTLADGSALWRKARAEVTKEEYGEFYNHVAGQFDEPALTVHYRAEGRQEFSALIFVPSLKPFDLFDPERKGRIKLYVRRVFITDEANILPGWLRFVRGVIDSEDLPLNISREMLQSNPLLSAIGGAVTSRILSELKTLAEVNKEEFLKIWEAFGPVLKEGIYEDAERRDALYEITRFRATRDDSWRSLADYVADMRPNQTAIYYALGDSREAIAASPHLEGFDSRGIEVLELSDPVDAFWVRTALGFDGKPFQSVTQGAADLDAVPLVDGDDAPTDDDDQVPQSAVSALIALFKQSLGERVSDVQLSKRLATSPVCLVAPETGPDRQLEKILSRAGQGGGASAPVLEVNPASDLIRALAEKAVAGGAAELLDDAAVVLLGEARILDGETPDDPADHAERINRLLARCLA